jgi:hypothetical protein
MFTYLLFIVIGFGWSLLFLRGELSLIEHLMISPVIFLSIFVSYSVILSVLGIQLTSLVGYFFMLFSLLVFFINNPFKEENFKKTFEKEELLLLSMFIASIIAKIVSVKGLSVPNLSDTITHTYYANLILKTGTIPFFYSPGLHVLSAFCDMLRAGPVVKQILYLTNFFSAYSGIIAYLYIKKVFKDKIAALAAALMFSLGIALSTFFYGGGKNSLVVAVPVLLFFLLIISLNQEAFSKAKNLLSVIILFSIFLVHYPTAVFAAIYWFVTFLVSSKKQKKNAWVPGLGVIIGMGYLFYTYFRYSIPNMDNVATPSLYSFSLPQDFIRSVREYFSFVVNAVSEHTFRGSQAFIPYLAYGGILFVFVKSISLKSDGRKGFRSFLFWFFSCLIFCSLLWIFQVTDLQIVLETYALISFVFFYIFLAFSISFFYNNVIKLLIRRDHFLLFTIIYSVLFTNMASSTFNDFEYMKTVNVVGQEDLEMFAWIDKNLPDEVSIVTNGFEAVPNLVGPSDSGGWLNYFTGNDISTPFWRFSDKKTLLNLKYYLDLQKDLGDCEAINYFLDNGFLYYFEGSLPARDVLAPKEQLETYGWEIVNSVGNSRLYKIPSCDPR